jgi:hypothetical protein
MRVFTIIFCKKPILMILPAGTLTVSGCLIAKSPNTIARLSSARCETLSHMGQSFAARPQSPSRTTLFVNRRSKLSLLTETTVIAGGGCGSDLSACVHNHWARQIAHLRRQPEGEDEKPLFVAGI